MASGKFCTKYSPQVMAVPETSPAILAAMTTSPPPVRKASLGQATARKPTRKTVAPSREPGASFRAWQMPRQMTETMADLPMTEGTKGGMINPASIRPTITRVKDKPAMRMDQRAMRLDRPVCIMIRPMIMPPMISQGMELPQEANTCLPVPTWKIT